METHDGPPNVKTMTDARVILMMLMAAGWSNAEIARETGYNANYISVMRHSPLFRAQIEDLQSKWKMGLVEDVMGKIEREAGASVDMLVTLRDDSGEGKAADRNVQRQAANDLLDRTAKFGKRRTDEVEHIHKIVLSRDDIAQMARAMPSAALAEAPPVIDAEPES